MRITIEVTVEEHAKLKAAAGLVKLGPWIRHAALSQAASENPARFAYPPASNLPREVGDSIVKNSDTLPWRKGVVSAAGEIGRTELPRSTPVRRKHINLREDAEEEKPGKKFRCTYLWPSRSKKCPHCHEVHTDV